MLKTISRAVTEIKDQHDRNEEQAISIILIKLLIFICQFKFSKELVKNVREKEKEQSRNSTDAQLQEETTRIQNESSQGSDGTTCPPRSIVLQVVSFDTPLSDESNSEKCTNSDPNQKDLTDAQQETQNTDPLNGNTSSQSTSQYNEAVQGKAAALSGISMSKHWQ
ncbi:hypothetical protein AAES_54249 [Amazona aestiva]|uniref:Uncharacterized protein n=1 Tax=Amazona aestiva TaxID=12930 RepID=A0A0Q3UTE3_AMAAE|nr:hypothetical protein AAES_54249 [Amazona aestiva]